MKKLLFSILFFFLVSLISAQDFQVTNTGIYSVDVPHLTFGGSQVHLVYGTNFLCYNFDIHGPSAPITNPIIPAENYGPNTADIAVDPLDSNHIGIAYYDFHYDANTGVQFYGCYVVESTDGGLTFDAPTLLDTIEMGNTLSNLSYNLPQVKFVRRNEYSDIKILWRVNSNSVDTNSLYLGGRYGGRDRMDDPNKDALEVAIGFTVENELYAVSYGIMENSHAKFYLSASGAGTHILVKDDGQTFLTSDNFTKAFVNHGGKLEYIYNDFSHSAQLTESGDWGATWSDKGTVDSHQYTYVAFTRITPTFPLYMESYFVKLFKDDNGDLIFSVSPDLLNWQDGGKVNSSNAQVSGMAASFIDVKLDDINKSLLTSWIDNRTGSEEIFYSNIELPLLVDVKNDIQTTVEFNLQQNYPNPFNPATTIKFSIPKAGQVTLRVYNLLGKQVAELVNSEMSAGNKTVNFDASNLSSGIYFYKLSTENFVNIKKMVLLQ